MSEMWEGSFLEHPFNRQSTSNQLEEVPYAI